MSIPAKIELRWLIDYAEIGSAWATGPVKLGQVVFTGSHRYKCSLAGTATFGNAPIGTVVGSFETTADGVQWQCLGYPLTPAAVSQNWKYATLPPTATMFTVGSNGAGSAPPWTDGPVPVLGDGAAVTFQIRTASVDGVTSDWVEVKQVVDTVTNTVVAPISVTATAVADGIDVSWTIWGKQSVGYDFVIERSADGYAWTGIARSDGTNYHDPIVDGGGYWYRVAAVSLGRLQSAWAVTAAQVFAKTVENGATRNTVSTGNPDFESGNLLWTMEGGWSIQRDAANAMGGNWYAKKIGGGDSSMYGTKFQVYRLEGVYASAWVRSAGAPTGTIKIGCRFYDKTGTLIATTNGTQYGSAIVAPGVTWTKITFNGLAVMDAAYAQFIVTTVGYTGSSASWSIDTTTTDHGVIVIPPPGGGGEIASSSFLNVLDTTGNSLQLVYDATPSLNTKTTAYLTYKMLRKQYDSQHTQALAQSVDDSDSTTKMTALTTYMSTLGTPGMVYDQGAADAAWQANVTPITIVAGDYKQKFADVYTAQAYVLDTLSYNVQLNATSAVAVTDAYTAEFTSVAAQSAVIAAKAETDMSNLIAGATPGNNMIIKLNGATAATLQGDLIAAGTITATKILDGAVGELKLAALAVSTAKLQVAAVDSSILATGAVIAGKIAAGTIVAADIAAATITAAKITAGTITGTEIATGTITAVKLVANTITAAQIAAGTITGTEIATNAITADKITAGTITSAKIAAGAIKGAALSVGPLYMFKSAAGGTGSGGSGTDGQCATINNDFSLSLPVVPNALSAAWMATDTETPGHNSTSPVLVMEGRVRGLAGNNIGFTFGCGASGFSGTWGAVLLQFASTTLSLYPQSGVNTFGTPVNKTITSLVDGDIIHVQWYNVATAEGYKCRAYVNGVLVASWLASELVAMGRNTSVLSGAFGIRMGSAAVSIADFATNCKTVISDGSITTEKLVADSITADKIAAGAITADKVMAGSITADKFVVGTGKNLLYNADWLQGGLILQWPPPTLCKDWSAYSASSSTFGFSDTLFGSNWSLGASTDHQNSSHNNTMAFAGNDACYVASGVFSVEPGAAYMASCYGRSWTVVSGLFLYFFDSGGYFLSETSHADVAPSSSSDTMTLAGFTRWSGRFVAPTNARFACFMLVKVAGVGSNLVFTHPMVELDSTTLGMTQPSPWDAGNSTLIDFNGIQSNALRTSNYAEALVAPAWIANHVYTAATRCTNGANHYIVRALSGGTSAASGGPTGTTMGIYDNTVIWDYLGPSMNTATAGAKLDKTGTAIKVASANLMIGMLPLQNLIQIYSVNLVGGQSAGTANFTVSQPDNNYSVTVVCTGIAGAGQVIGNCVIAGLTKSNWKVTFTLFTILAAGVSASYDVYITRTP